MYSNVIVSADRIVSTYLNVIISFIFNVENKNNIDFHWTVSPLKFQSIIIVWIRNVTQLNPKQVQK